MNDYKTLNDPESQQVSDFHHEDDEVFSYANYRIEDWIALILFWALALTVFSQFVSRYVFSAPLGWTEEVARYQLVCLGFIGGCMGIRNNSHIFVSLFHQWMPERLSVVIYKVIGCFNVVFIAMLAYSAWQIIPLLHIHKMASISLPISVLYGVVFASLLIMLLRSSQFLIQLFNPSHTTNNTQAPTSCD
ncbi:TRAP transporter small permease [Algibacillus agarilyticus]|uniref:TRAP transporter small permease n=1 Tax=Algibacillus agarilyticus TaxID=2234133 RepID=UPI000DD098C0|nr:TRAP transporter small permease [Algibacillus agarilyticus]